MSPELAAVGIVAIAGAVVAVSARQSRVAILGLTIVLVATPLLVVPGPDLPSLGGRLLAAILAGYLLWVATRDPGVRTTAGSRLAWPVEAIAAGSAAVAGIALATDGELVEALAVGCALAVLALGPLAAASDPLRLTVGMVLLLGAAGLLRVALVGPPSGLEQLVTGWVAVALAGTMAYLVSRRTGPGEGPAQDPLA